MTNNLTNNEQLHVQLQRELGIDPNIPVEALNDQDVKAITDVKIVEGDEHDVDPIETAMTNAVNTPTSVNTTSPNLGLNWGTDGDAALTEWMNRRI